MTEPRPCRVRCKVCPCEWHARDPVASWRNHWRLMHVGIPDGLPGEVAVRMWSHSPPTRRSMFEGVMGR